jgi:hypothetical protein
MAKPEICVAADLSTDEIGDEYFEYTMTVRGPCAGLRRCLLQDHETPAL